MSKLQSKAGRLTYAETNPPAPALQSNGGIPQPNRSRSRARPRYRAFAVAGQTAALRGQKRTKLATDVFALSFEPGGMAGMRFGQMLPF
jgi:hypothetical protein